MTGLAYGPLGELLGFVVTAVGSAFFTVAGLLVEQAALTNLLAGQSVFGLWELYMGALALVVGVYVLGYETAWHQLQTLRQSA